MSPRRKIRLGGTLEFVVLEILETPRIPRISVFLLGSALLRKELVHVFVAQLPKGKFESVLGIHSEIKGACFVEDPSDLSVQSHLESDGFRLAQRIDHFIDLRRLHLMSLLGKPTCVILSATSAMTEARMTNRETRDQWSRDQ